MKKTFAFVLAAVLVFLMSSAAYGSVSETSGSPVTVTEVPDVSIILNGSLVSFQNVPVLVNGSTLLPLREFLVSLGVPDDSIRYDSKEKAVEVKYELTRILLYIDKKEAYINEELVVLNAAPVLYKSRTYIPARTVAEALGKKVVWDKTTRSVLICDAERFETVKEIFTKSDEATRKIERYKTYTEINATSKIGDVKQSMEITALEKLDMANKKMHMEVNMKLYGFEIKTESFYLDNTEYSFEPYSRTWHKTIYNDEEYNKQFESQNNAYLDVNETRYAVLTPAESENPDEIVLIGDSVFLVELFNDALQQRTDALVAEDMKLSDYDTFDMTIVLDKNTYLIKNITIYVSSALEMDSDAMTTEINVLMRYEDYNGDFSVTVPEDVVKNAILNETESGTW